MANIKELSRREDRLAGGHRLCAGCGASIAVRQILLGAGEDPVVCGSATGCLEVSTTLYPYTSWRTGFIHNAFENSAATISGVESAYQALKRAGKIPADKKIRFVAFGGDGGTYDIGLQSLSGAMERGHDMVYVCYDNGAYMNTGIQRSGATPRGAWASTSEVGKAQQGKQQRRKDLTSIIAAHGIPYVAQASISHWKDLTDKAEKAFNTPGPAFINVLATCPRGWRIPYNKSVEIAKLAVQTGYWPLFEVVDGVWRQTVRVVNRKPIEEFLKPQGRFKHLFKEDNAALLAEIQTDVDDYWAYVQRRCAEQAPAEA
jgi:pyruvate ferredoxin oxidoreductase beta subunit